MKKCQKIECLRSGICGHQDKPLKEECKNCECPTMPHSSHSEDSILCPHCPPQPILDNDFEKELEQISFNERKRTEKAILSRNIDLIKRIEGMKRSESEPDSIEEIQGYNKALDKVREMLNK